MKRLFTALFFAVASFGADADENLRMFTLLG